MVYCVCAWVGSGLLKDEESTDAEERVGTWTRLGLSGPGSLMEKWKHPKLTGFLIYSSPRGQSFYTQFSNKETNSVNLSGRGPHRGSVFRL